MSQGMSLHANYAGIDQGAADMSTHGANWGDVADRAKQIATKACEEMGHGAGSPEHATVMRKLDSLVQEHKNGIHLQQTGTQNAGDTFVNYGRRMANRMGSTQV